MHLASYRFGRSSEQKIDEEGTTDVDPISSEEVKEGMPRAPDHVESCDKEGHSKVSNAQQAPTELMNEANQHKEVQISNKEEGSQGNEEGDTTGVDNEGKLNKGAPAVEQTSNGDGDQLVVG